MAGSTAARAAELSERDYQRDVNVAIANTEAEIMAEAIGDKPLDNDADTSLEEMGEGLEGETVEDDGETKDGEETEGDGEASEDDAETGETDEAGEAEAEGEEGDDANANDQKPQGQDRGRKQPVGGVPPGKHREVAQRARTAEDRAGILERELAETRGRLDELSRRVNAPPPKAQEQEKPDLEPDMFADPEGWKAWNRRQAESIADDRANRVLGSFRQEQQEARNQRLNDNLSVAASGPRGFEFQAAYRALTSLNSKDPVAVRMVRGIIDSPDPSAALFDWWEENGGPEYREDILSQLMPERQARQPGNGQQRRGAPNQNRQQPGQQPRQVFRGPQPLRSLNGAQGSNSQRQSNLEDLDGSDESIWDFATRPTR